jgi:hypothetical protein
MIRGHSEVEKTSIKAKEMLADINASPEALSFG